MKTIHAILPGIFFSIMWCQAYAVTIYECVDEEGNSVFQDRCPPGTTPEGEMKIRTGSGSEPAKPAPAGSGAPDVDITLYAAPECDACLILRGVLEQYSAVFSEKNINQSDDVKRELQEKMGGSTTLTIPTTIIGEKIIAGFKKDELISTLESAGFSKPEPEDTSPESEPVEEPTPELSSETEPEPES
jgi:glutaredoxin